MRIADTMGEDFLKREREEWGSASGCAGKLASRNNQEEG